MLFADFTFILSYAEGAKVMNELRNDALKEIFKRLHFNKLTKILLPDLRASGAVMGLA